VPQKIRGDSLKNLGFFGGIMFEFFGWKNSIRFFIMGSFEGVIGALKWRSWSEPPWALKGIERLNKAIWEFLICFINSKSRNNRSSANYSWWTRPRERKESLTRPKPFEKQPKQPSRLYSPGSLESPFLAFLGRPMSWMATDVKLAYRAV